MVARLDFGLLRPLDLGGAVQAFDSARSRRMQQERTELEGQRLQADIDAETRKTDEAARAKAAKQAAARFLILGEGGGGFNDPAPPVMTDAPAAPAMPAVMPAQPASMPAAPAVAPMQADPAAMPMTAPQAPVAADMAAPATDEPMATVSAPRVNPIWNELIETDPEQAIALWEKTRTMSKQERDERVKRFDGLIAAYSSLSGIPEGPQRDAAKMQLAPMLVQSGIPMAEIEAFPTDNVSLQAATNRALGMKGVLEEQGRRRDDVRADAQLDVSRGQLAVSQANLGVAQANLGLRAREVAQNGVGGLTPRQATQTTMQLRKEFDGLPEVKNFKQVIPILAAVRNAPDTPAGDLQLAYAVGGILDPGSVVREGEQAMVFKSGSLMEQIMGTTRFVADGKARLTPQTRKNLEGMLNQRILPMRQQYDAAYQNYASLAGDNGLDPRQIVGRHAVNAFTQSRNQPRAAAEAPAVGTVQNGWRFKGGDPARRTNWERAS